ncbi:MAG: hypothetical protein N3E41_08875 [Thermofilaceae archaeon]|nr:hypothetical protein [Thermofilaceae archaeon]
MHQFARGARPVSASDHFQFFPSCISVLHEQHCISSGVYLYAFQFFPSCIRA